MRRAWFAALTLMTIAVGVTLRRVPLGLPFLLVKYGGSALWAMMLYWLCATLYPTASPRPLAVAALLLATAVECFKLVHTPGLDLFRQTLAGKLLLGRFFSPWDLLAYALAIILTASVDRRLRQTS